MKLYTFIIIVFQLKTVVKLDRKRPLADMILGLQIDGGNLTVSGDIQNLQLCGKCKYGLTAIRERRTIKNQYTDTQNRAK